MDIHKPKPVHSWREFFSEILVIVIGVLIALGGEQIVEAIHWHLTIAEESAALDSNVREMWAAMSARVADQPCVDQKLSDIAVILDRHHRGQPLGIIGPIGRPTVWSGNTEAFQVAAADGSLSHMALDQKAAYFGVLEGYNDFQRAAPEERENWRALGLLSDAAAMDNEDWRDVRRAYRLELDSNRVLKNNLTFSGDSTWLGGFRRFPKLPPNKEELTLPTVRDLCTPSVERHS